MRAQRFDVVRDRTARILFDKIDSSGKQIMPMLYNRESRQIVRGPVDGNRVRAWAKGRWLSADYRASLPSDLYGDDGKGEGGGAGEGEEEEILEEDDSHLTTRQRDGKDAMRRRLERGAKSKSKKGEEDEKE